MPAFFQMDPVVFMEQFHMIELRSGGSMAHFLISCLLLRAVANRQRMSALRAVMDADDAQIMPARYGDGEGLERSWAIAHRIR